MKLFSTIILLLLVFDLGAQTFPFDEGFHGILTYQIPSGWSGDMNVQPYHGLNDDKGLVATIGSTDVVDSAVTPWIGPLAANTEFIFWYRMVDDFIFPSTERHLRKNDKLELLLSTDSINYSVIYTVDSTNHIPNTNFKKITFTNTNYSGQVVKIMFSAQHGGGASYYVDIDSIKVRQEFTLGMGNGRETMNFNIYPNPINAGDFFQFSVVSFSESNRIELLNCFGQVVYTTEVNQKNSPLPTPVVPGIYFLQYGNQIRKLVVR